MNTLPTTLKDTIGLGLPSILYLVFSVLAVFITALILGILVHYLDRRISADIQLRIGPKRSARLGLLQPLADLAKLFHQQPSTVFAVHPTLIRLSPVLLLIGAFMMFPLIPFGDRLVVSRLETGIILAFIAYSMTTLGSFISGSFSGDARALVGGIRALSSWIGFLFPSMLAVLGVVLRTGSLSLTEIAALQGGEPWKWIALADPFMLILFILFFISGAVLAGFTPFDTAHSDSELGSGYDRRFAGLPFAYAGAARIVNVVMTCSLSVTLFLGGWKVPFVGNSGGALVEIAGIFAFFVKVLFLSLIMIWMKWSLPRFRSDHLTNFCWKFMVPAGFISATGSSLWMLFTVRGP